MKGGYLLNYYGIIVGFLAFFIIGIFHPIVIKSEYYFGKKCWPVFLIFGFAAIFFSLLIKDTIKSTIIGIIGFTSLWAIHEIYEQEQRVVRGWFPKNPNR